MNFPANLFPEGAEKGCFYGDPVSPHQRRYRCLAMISFALVLRNFEFSVPYPNLNVAQK